jgi:hypothetical protein
MNDIACDPKRRFLKSPWLLVTIAIILSLITPCLLDLYGVGHWPIMQTAYVLEGEAKALSSEVIPSIQGDDKVRKKALGIAEQLNESSKKLKRAGAVIMRAGALYHLTALVSFLCTAFAFFFRPRWGGLISLPFSLFAMIFFFVIM